MVKIPLKHLCQSDNGTGCCDLTYKTPCVLFLADYGVESYDIGTAFGHFGIAVEDVSSKLISLWTFSILLTGVQFSADAV